MLKGYEKFKVPDMNKTRYMTWEVNWNEGDPVTNECKVIRVTFPNGDLMSIKREHLNAILFALGNSEEQRQMVPQTLHRSKWYETILGITAMKNIQKGEKINVRVKIPLPTVSEEVVSEMKRDVLKKGLTRFLKR